MQDDRYKVNKGLYLSGMFALVVAMGLFMFACYLVPYLFFGLSYDVPEFVFILEDYFQVNWAIPKADTDVAIFAVFFIPTMALGWFSYWASNRLDNEMPSLIGEENQGKIPSMLVDLVIQLLKFVFVLAAIVLFIWGTNWFYFS